MSEQKKIQDVNNMLDTCKIVSDKFGDVGKTLIADMADVGKESVKKEMEESEWFYSNQAQDTENALAHFFASFGGLYYQDLHDDEIHGWLKEE
jgi:hypothetical protein